MNIWLEFFKFALPVVLQNKSALAIVCAAFIGAACLPPMINAYNNNEVANRIIAAQVAGDRAVVVRLEETTEAVRQLTRHVDKDADRLAFNPAETLALKEK